MLEGQKLKLRTHRGGGGALAETQNQEWGHAQCTREQLSKPNKGESAADVARSHRPKALDYVAGWFSGQRTLKWRLVCRMFIRECSWDKLLRKGKKVNRAGESWVVMQSQRVHQPTRQEL